MEVEHISLAERISQGVHLDSLPYIDKEYDEPGMQERIDSMIQEEMKTFRPQNYLAEWPMPELQFDTNPELQKEWERIQKKQPLNGFDINKYTLEEPSGENMLNEDAWRKTIDISRMQLEYQKEKLENLQLLEKFGSNAWRISNDNLDAIVEKMDGDLEELQKKTEMINRKRKLDQEGSYDKLASMSNQIMELQMKNAQIEKTCEALEERLKKQKVE